MTNYGCETGESEFIIYNNSARQISINYMNENLVTTNFCVRYYRSIPINSTYTRRINLLFVRKAIVGKKWEFTVHPILCQH